MKRQIKFRIWDEKTKMFWHNLPGATRHGLIITSNGTPGVVCDLTDPPSPDKSINYFERTYLTVEQWTGLKDKNGTDIYENDILLVTPEMVKGHVKYLAAIPGYTLGHPLYPPFRWDMHLIDEDVGDGWMSSGGQPVRTHEASSKRLEVIGNIHEHPAILGPIEFP